MPESSITGVPSLEIPAISELAKLSQWVCWKVIDREGRKTKVPISARTGRYAAVDDPSTWTSYQEACSTFVKSADLAGIGFVFTEGDPYCGIDLDKCRNPETGILTPYAQNAVSILQSYTEISPSGTGVHVLGRGNLGKGYRNDGLRVECYSSSRYFSITGVPFDGTEMEINDCQEFLNQIIAEASNKSRNGAAGEAAISPQMEQKLSAYLAQMPAMLDAKAEPPADKFEALGANDPNFYAAYKESVNTECEPFPSASNRDFALASYGARAGWSVAEITALLISARRLHGDDLKLRKDYYALTIGKIVEGLAVKKNSKMPLDQLLAAIGHTCKVEIYRIIKYLADPPYYEIKTAKGSIRGDVEMLMEQRAFKRSIGAAAGYAIPDLEKEAWHEMSQQLLDACEEEDVGAEATLPGQMVSWLRDYFYEAPEPREFTAEAMAEGNPFMEKGDLYVCTGEFEKWVRRSLGSKVESRRLGIMLKTTASSVSHRTATTIGGKIVSASIWKVPAGLAIEFGGKAA